MFPAFGFGAQIPPDYKVYLQFSQHALCSERPAFNLLPEACRATVQSALQVGAVWWSCSCCFSVQTVFRQNQRKRNYVLGFNVCYFSLESKMKTDFLFLLRRSLMTSLWILTRTTRSVQVGASTSRWSRKNYLNLWLRASDVGGKLWCENWFDDVSPEPPVVWSPDGSGADDEFLIFIIIKLNCWT